MTKKDMILKISEDTGLKQVDVKEVVQKTFDMIVDSLSGGDKGTRAAASPCVCARPARPHAALLARVCSPAPLLAVALMYLALSARE